MISFRQLLLIALVIGIIWLFSQLRQRLMDKPMVQKRAAGKQDYTETVRCRYCGVYTLRQDAVGNEQDGYACREPSCITARKKN